MLAQGYIAVCMRTRLLSLLAALLGTAVDIERRRRLTEFLFIMFGKYVLFVCGAGILWCGGGEGLCNFILF